MREPFREDRWGKQTEEMEKSGHDLKLDAMEQKIIDLRKTLMGDSTAKRWQEIQIELTRTEKSLRSLLETRNHNCTAGNERYSNMVEPRPPREIIPSRAP